MAGYPITEVRGCLLCVERFVRKHLRGCCSQLHTGQFRERANPTGLRGDDGDRRPSHAHARAQRRKVESGKVGGGDAGE